MFKVIVFAYGVCKHSPYSYSAEKEIRLPFVPMPGLRLTISDAEDPEIEISDVVWDVGRNRFEVFDKTYVYDFEDDPELKSKLKTLMQEDIEMLKSLGFSIKTRGGL